ncbi:hypothetical protein [Bacillus sp. FJAT-22090]|uniref:hypothetical protein n=1 Tax=Bacillus sp. FJAT-22090 TaxID=1581038 RepID=UPI0011A8FC7A|nr:hypothetical protein [Bacillus sp. FJAT-22090]
MQHQWIPAKKNDIIKKVESHYYSELENGEHFVVLDVFNGDNTAIVLGKDGELKSLSYPEEYEVVGRTRDLVDEMHMKMRKESDEYEAKIAEQKANGTYIDPVKWLEKQFGMNKVDNSKEQHE